MTDADVSAVLDELLADTASLTRVLLGGERKGGPEAPGPHDWLEQSLHAE